MRRIAFACLLLASAPAWSQDCRATSHPRYREDVTWCRIHEANDRDAVLWRAETRIVRVGAADDPLSPAYPVELFHDLCPACENRTDRILYISRKIAEPADDGPRRVAMDAMLVYQMMDLAKLAMSKGLRVRVVVRTDLVGKRNLHGKFRDPIVRIAVLAR